MELYQLRYFVAVAAHEHVHRAAAALHVSPPSLSRTIAVLEEELAVPLFVRSGRRIALSDAGRRFACEARKILASVDDAIAATKSGGRVPITIAGRETLLARYASAVLEAAVDPGPPRQPLAATLTSTSGPRAIELAREARADVVLCVEKLPADFHTRVLDELLSVIVVGPGHALYARARSGASTAIGEVLKHDFACSARSLGGEHTSPDGWRDDAFPRNVRFTTDSAHAIVTLVNSGLCLAYLPSFLLDQPGSRLVKLKTSGCPYECRWTVRLGVPKGEPRPFSTRVLKTAHGSH